MCNLPSESVWFLQQLLNQALNISSVSNNDKFGCGQERKKKFFGRVHITKDDTENSGFCPQAYLLKKVQHQTAQGQVGLSHLASLKWEILGNLQPNRRNLEPSIPCGSPAVWQLTTCQGNCQSAYQSIHATMQHQFLLQPVLTGSSQWKREYRLVCLPLFMPLA